MSRLRSTIQSKYKKAVDRYREALASDITIYWRTGEKISSSATYDPINKEVLDMNSPGVDGNYFLDEIKTTIIKANYSFIGVGDRFSPLVLPAGNIDITDVEITCKLSDVLIDKTNPAGDTYFHRATKVIINDLVFIIKTTPFAYGLSGDLYNCYVKATLDKNA